ncbi:MAG: response regulator transcription factor [Caldilineaceae bacterium]|nr:response regulator transcription factor [Caldilineaceae bacterium]
MTGERILIVEDERAVARGLEYGLQADGYQVIWARTGAEALQLARAENPALITLDIRLPDTSGYDVCRALRAEGFHQPVLMLTARDEEVDKVLGLELGADDYVVKPYSLREVTARIRALLRRAYGDLSGQEQNTPLRFGDLEIDPARFSVRRAGETIELTPTEFRVLHHLVSQAGWPVTRTALIEAVWGYDSDIGGERTVDVHIRHLRTKIEDDPANPRYVITVRGVGYRFEG